MKKYLALSVAFLLIISLGIFTVQADPAGRKTVTSVSENTENDSFEEITLEPVKDAYINKLEPSQNYGEENDLWVGDYPDDWVTRSLLKFDLSAIPSYAKIHSAALNLYLYNWDDSDNYEVSVHTLNGSWTETGVTWNNSPSYSSNPVDTNLVGFPTPPHYVVWDFTDAMENMMKTNNGFLVKMKNENNGNPRKMKIFRSSENESYSPALVVKYSEWVPYVPDKEEVEIDISPKSPTEDNEISAKVSITFNNQGYRVNDWGKVSRDNKVFSVNAEIERYTGPSAMALKPVENSYSLGQLEEGNYEFRFKACDEAVESKEFTVGEGTMIEHELTISCEGGGTTEPSSGTYTYDEGEEVTVKAIPEENQEFVEWSGDVVSENKNITLTMNSDKSITANFTELEEEGLPQLGIGIGITIIVILIIVIVIFKSA